MDIEIKTINLKEYREDTQDYLGEFKGKEIVVDLHYLKGNVKQETGIYIFKGFKSSITGAFIPIEELEEVNLSEDYTFRNIHSVRNFHVCEKSNK